MAAYARTKNTLIDITIRKYMVAKTHEAKLPSKVVVCRHAKVSKPSRDRRPFTKPPLRYITDMRPVSVHGHTLVFSTRTFSLVTS